MGMILHHGLVAVEMVSQLFGRPIYFEILTTEVFWVLQQIFVAAFLLISGICTAFSKSVLRRGGIITGAALVITLVTGFLLPAVGFFGMEIWFGILHLFGLSMLLYGLFTCKKKWVSVAAGLVLFIILLIAYRFRDLEFSLWIRTILGFPFPGFYSADYYPLFPFFFIFLAGTYLGPAVRDHRLPAKLYEWRIRPIEWVGRRSLWVYIAHQPIIFGIVAFVFYIST